MLVLRRSRLAWLFLFLMLTSPWYFIYALAHAIPPQIPVPDIDERTVAQVQMSITAFFLWVFMAAGLVGEALRSLRRLTAFHVTPGHRVQLRRFLWLLFVLLWFLNVLPLLFLFGPSHWWWAAPISLGMTGMVIAAAAAIFALGRIEQFSIAGPLLLLPLLWKPLRNEIYRLTLSASSVDPLHAKFCWASYCWRAGRGRCVHS
jgi:hypothetical protein